MHFLFRRQKQVTDQLNFPALFASVKEEKHCKLSEYDTWWTSEMDWTQLWEISASAGIQPHFQPISTDVSVKCDSVEMCIVSVIALLTEWSLINRFFVRRRIWMNAI